jgi:hypothetical protein
VRLHGRVSETVNAFGRRGAQSAQFDGSSTLASGPVGRAFGRPSRRLRWTSSGSATWPDPLHPVHGHDVGACELPIGGSSSTVAVATRQRQQRRADCSYPCSSGAPALISRAHGALLLSCTQASVAEFRRQTLAPDGGCCTKPRWRSVVVGWSNRSAEPTGEGRLKRRAVVVATTLRERRLSISPTLGVCATASTNNERMPRRRQAARLDDGPGISTASRVATGLRPVRRCGRSAPRPKPRAGGRSGAAGSTR